MRKPNGASRKTAPAALALVTAALVTAAAMAGAAQVAPASPPAPAPISPPAPAPVSAPASAAPYVDPPVPGVCLLSQKVLLTNSLVGRSVATRLEQLQQQVQASHLKAKRSLDAAAKALQAEWPTLPEIQREAKQQALGQRQTALQIAETRKDQQLELTQAKVVQQIIQEAQPVEVAAYQSRHCGVLFDRAAVVLGGAGLDITESVIQGLNAKITTLTFNLEPPPEPSGN